MGSLRKLVRVWVALSSATMLAMPAVPAAQQDAGQGPVIRSQVNLVNVFATVRDKNKRIVGDLKQDDFKIVEDGQDQKIAFFSKEVSLPITLALLLDTSGSEQDMLGAIQAAGSSFLDRVLRHLVESLKGTHGIVRMIEGEGPSAQLVARAHLGRLTDQGQRAFRRSSAASKTAR